MTPLDPIDVRARKRPLAIAVVSAYTLVSGYLVAMPIHAWAKRVWGSHPLGDEVLFRPGGRELVTWIGEGDAAIAVAISSAFMLLLVAIFLGNVVFGALVASLATQGGRRTDPLRAGFASFVPLAGASIAMGAMQLMLVALGMFGGSAVATFCEPRWGDATGFVARVGVVALSVVVAGLVGILADLARVAIAHEVATSDARVSALRRIGSATRDALSLLRKRFRRILFDWTLRALPSFALFVLGFHAGSYFGARGGYLLFALFAIHQLVVLARVALRASWLASIVRLGS